MRWPNTECQVFEFRSKLFNKPHFMYLLSADKSETRESVNLPVQHK